MPEQVLYEVIKKAKFIKKKQNECWESILKELSKNGIVIIVEDAGHLAQMTHSNEVNNAIKSLVLKIDNGEIDK